MRKAMLVALVLFSCSKKDERQAQQGVALPAAPDKPAEIVTDAEASKMALDEGAAGRPADDRRRAIESARTAGILGSARPGAAGYAASADTPAFEPSPGVAAGEWDDNANYRDYLKWLQHTQIARLDARNRQFIVVTDKAGKPMPNCPISVTSGQQTAQLLSTVSGRALLFPHAFGLQGSKLTATTSCLSEVVAAELDASKEDGVTVLKLGAERTLPARRTIDLAFVLDTTGSMGEEIQAVKSTIRAVAGKLSNDQTSVRIGLVEYKDRSDSVVTRTFQFSPDLAAFGRSVAALTADGGGDMPEDMQAGLTTAIDKLEWSTVSVARMMVVIADAPPHLDYQDEKDYADSAKRAAAKGIKVFTVSASGMDDTGQVVMRQLSQFTGAANMFVLRGGAGPQSTGGGDPKDSCGGTHDNYSSGNLDELIVKRVKQELKSLDADPMLIAGRGQDENSKPCAKRIVMK